MAMTFRWAIFVSSALSLAACQGLIGESTGEAPAPGRPSPGGPAPTASPGPTDPDPPPVVTPTPSPSPVDTCAGATLALEDLPLVRLTPEQYEATVRDLLGDPGLEATLDDAAQIITERGVRQLQETAELAMSRRARWTREIFPCDPSGARDDACAEALIDGFGGRAFRRPLSAEERAGLVDTYRSAATDLGFADALEAIVEVILQSPQVLYIDEGAGARAPGKYAIDGFGAASRLSYFLWGTMPDDALFAAAAQGRLATPAGLAAEADRMLRDPRAAQTIERFVWRWLQLDGGRLHHALEAAIKDEALFPEYDAELVSAMRAELEAFVRRVVIEQDGTFQDLLTSREAYVNAELAELYGVTGGPTGDRWAWVELDPSERAGLLTRAAFLTVFGSARVHSPIRRGVFVIEEMLCNELGDPPPNANDVPVEGGTVTGSNEVRTVRQDVEARTSGANCNSCHQVINPTGFAFEHFDAIGRHRELELGTELPIDASGRLTGSDVDGAVRGAVELSERLASSQTARSCFARRWAAQAFGQKLHSIDRCFVELQTPRFLETGSVRGLIVDLVASEPFSSVIIGGGN